MISILLLLGMLLSPLLIVPLNQSELSASAGQNCMDLAVRVLLVPGNTLLGGNGGEVDERAALRELERETASCCCGGVRQ